MASHLSHAPSTPAQPSDDVAAQLRDLERQGGGMARLAHICAGLLLAAFSLGSLISISATAFFRFLAEWNASTFDLPDAISLVVNLLLVLAADVALLYAASVLRTLIAAQAPASEQRIHRYAMIGASLLESSTYLYLVWTFDKPTTLFLWAIGITRALGAPLFAAYLSMARPLPVGPRDVAYQAALAAGKGVVRDVTVLAGDPTAPLARKVRIYSSAALMSPQDASRFAGIIAAVSEDEPPQLSAPESTSDTRPPEPPTPPRGRPDELPGEPAADSALGHSPYAPPLRLIPARTAGVRAQVRKVSRLDALRTQAFALLSAHPEMTKAELRAALRVRRETANALYAQWVYSDHGKRAAR